MGSEILVFRMVDVDLCGFCQLPTTNVVGLCAVGPTPQRQFNCRCSSSAIRERGFLSRFGVVSPRRKGRLTTAPSMKEPHMVSSRVTVLTLFCPHGSVDNHEEQTINCAVGLPPTTKLVGFRPRNQCERPSPRRRPDRPPGDARGTVGTSRVPPVGTDRCGNAHSPGPRIPGPLPALTPRPAHPRHRSRRFRRRIRVSRPQRGTRGTRRVAGYVSPSAPSVDL